MMGRRLDSLSVAIFVGKSRLGNRRNQSGFTYIAVLALVVVVGIGAASAIELVSTIKQRDDEVELLFRGMAYRDAIMSYYNSGKTVKTFPRKLTDLLLDPRYVHRRHIRRLYDDPVSDQGWTLIQAPDGGIQGVASKSKKKPRKIGNFPFGFESFKDSEHYSDWLFVYDPLVKLIQPQQTVSSYSTNND